MLVSGFILLTSLCVREGRGQEGGGKEEGDATFFFLSFFLWSEDRGKGEEEKQRVL